MFQSVDQFATLLTHPYQQHMASTDTASISVVLVDINVAIVHVNCKSYGHVDTRTNGHTNTWANGHKNKWTHEQKDTSTHGQMNTSTKWTNEQRDK